MKCSWMNSRRGRELFEEPQDATAGGEDPFSRRGDNWDAEGTCGSSRSRRAERAPDDRDHHSERDRDAGCGNRGDKWQRDEEQQQDSNPRPFVAARNSARVTGRPANCTASSPSSSENVTLAGAGAGGVSSGFIGFQAARIPAERGHRGIAIVHLPARHARRPWR